MAQSCRSCFGVEACAQIALLVTPCNETMDDGIVGLEEDGFLQETQRSISNYRHRRRRERQCTEKEIVGVEVFWSFAPCSLDLDFSQVWLNRSDDTHRQEVLQGE